MTGSSFSSDSTYDFTTIKYNSVGDEQWVARYKGSGYGSKRISVDALGNVYVSGSILDTSLGIIMIKYDNNGIENWVSRYEGQNGSVNASRDMKIDALGNVYVTGESWNVDGDWDVYTTIKYNSNGVEQWVAAYEDSVGDYGTPNALIVDDSGNVFVTGSRWPKGTNDHNYVTVKYNTEGIKLWESRYEGIGGGLDDPSAIVIDEILGNVYVTGESGEGFNNSPCYATVKYNVSRSRRMGCSSRRFCFTKHYLGCITYHCS